MTLNFDSFIDHLASYKNYSPQTVQAYRSDLKLFAAFAQERSITRIAQVDHVVIREYIEHMRRKENPRSGQTGLSDASVARRLAALNGYFEYVRGTDDHKLRNPLKDFSHRWRKNNEPKPVDDAILDRLLATVSNDRDHVLFALFLATGLRVSEMYQLNRDSITIEMENNVIGEQQILGVGEVVGKGNKRRKFYVDDATLMIWASYVNKREDQNEALFLSERKQRMSVRAIQHTLATLCQKAGVAHINVHRLRHSYATRLANANISSMVLKDLMGHASFTTTQRYFKLTDTTLARGYFSAMEYLK